MKLWPNKFGPMSTSLGSLLNCITTLSVKDFSLKSSLNFPWYSFKPFAPTIDHWKEEITASLSTPFHEEIVDSPNVTRVTFKDLCVTV